MSPEANIRAVLDCLSSLLHAVCNTDRPTLRHSRPLILGLSGLQGSGKSTWASVIVEILSSDYGLKAIQISLDDLYKTHKELVRLREENNDNRLLRTRGQPGTHDEELARNFFEGLRKRTPGVRVPVFDKSQHHGEGDRLREDQWPLVPQDLDVVVFEGWCVGFQPLSENEIYRRWQKAVRVPSEEQQSLQSTVTLANHPVEHLRKLNADLEHYYSTFMGPKHFDYFIHLDTEHLANVYTWRLQQEQALLKTRGSAMSEKQVIDFVRGYMPAYELYLDQLRSGFFSRQDLEDGRKRHIRVCLGSRREVLDVQTI